MAEISKIEIYKIKITIIQYSGKPVGGKKNKPQIKILNINS